MDFHTELLPEVLPPEPLIVVGRWLDEAWRLRHQPNPNSMVVATVGEGGDLSARVVLCKDLVPQPGYLVFYTNYHSRKGQQLAEHPRAAAVIHWDHLHRQVRIEGPVVTAPAEESDAYFASRPWQSRIGAWASQQSEPVNSREQLVAAVQAVTKRFGVTEPWQANTGPGIQRVVGDPVIPRPPHWGGYRLWAEKVELWVEGAGRIHDRARWSRTLTKRADGGFETGHWSAARLQP